MILDLLSTPIVWIVVALCAWALIIILVLEAIHA